MNNQNIVCVPATLSLQADVIVELGFLIYFFSWEPLIKCQCCGSSGGCLYIYFFHVVLQSYNT